MKLNEAVFRYSDRAHSVSVSFVLDVVSIELDDKEVLRLDNKPRASGGRPWGGRTWKPCETHCRALIRRATGKQPATEHAKRRIKKDKPSLRIFG